MDDAQVERGEDGLYCFAVKTVTLCKVFGAAC